MYSKIYVRQIICMEGSSWCLYAMGSFFYFDIQPAHLAAGLLLCEWAEAIWAVVDRRKGETKLALEAELARFKYLLLSTTRLMVPSSQPIAQVGSHQPTTASRPRRGEDAKPRRLLRSRACKVANLAFSSFFTHRKFHNG